MPKEISSHKAYIKVTQSSGRFFSGHLVYEIIFMILTYLFLKTPHKTDMTKDRGLGENRKSVETRDNLTRDFQPKNQQAEHRSDRPLSSAAIIYQP